MPSTLSANLQDPPPTNSLKKWAYAMGAACLIVYFATVLLGKAFAKPGASAPLGDVGEFLIVLAGMTCFVIGLLNEEHKETVHESSTSIG